MQLVQVQSRREATLLIVQVSILPIKVVDSALSMSSLQESSPESNVSRVSMAHLIRFVCIRPTNKHHLSNKQAVLTRR